MTQLSGTNPAENSPANPRRVLAIVCVAVVMASLDLFIVNVALPSIARDLHDSSLGELSWVVNGYAIVYASLLVFLGRLAEARRRDRAFMLGLALFTVSSALCAAATSVATLVAFRLIQAAGAALLTPTSLGLVLASYPPERRHGAVRAWTAVGGGAAALGPVIGGALVASSWRWVFLVNVPIGIATLVVARRYLPAVPGAPVERPDPTGALTVTLGIALLCLALVEGRPWGWASPPTVAALAASAALLGGFALHVARARHPLISPDLFRSPPFRAASLVAVFFSVTFGAMLLSVVLWEQDVWHWSAVVSGLAMAPGPFMVPVISFLVAGRLIARLGAGRVMALGSVVFAAGLTWWSFSVSLAPNYVASILPGSILNGVGVGLALPTFMATASSSLPASAFSTGSAVVTMLRQTGIAVGVALVIALVGSTAGPSTLSNFERSWRVAAGIALLAAIASSIALRRARVPSPATALAD
jgi:EmrB/QacA subfamily drug resistance transporter